jgi:hypothetical protein
MVVLEMVKYGDPILTRPCARVEVRGLGLSEVFQ